MGWNDPGGNNRDPWSGGGGNQGPPDLDELLRKAKERLRSMFGQGSGGGGENGGTGGGLPIGPTGIGVIAAVIVLAWLASGIYIVNEGQRGVELTFGANTGVTSPGPHWHVPAPLGQVEHVDVSEVRTAEIGYQTVGGGSTRGVPAEALMLTRDENIVNLKVAIQYRVTDPGAYLFNHRSPDDTLKQLAESALREVVGKAQAPEGTEVEASGDLQELAEELGDELTEDQLASLMSGGSTESEDLRPTPLEWVLTQGRAEVADKTEQLMQDTLDDYEAGLTLVRVAIQDAQPPEEVQPAFADAIRAREDQQRTISRAKAYANALVPRAQGQAARIREEAQGYLEQAIARARGESERFTALREEYQRAPGVTGERLYVQTIESVLSQSSKIMVDVEGGQPLMYLPLDRMLERRSAGDKQGADDGSKDKSNSGNGQGDYSGSASAQSGSSRFSIPNRSDSQRSREVR